MMRFGLIGLGGIGEVRKQALEVSTECELTAAFDLDSTALARLPGHVSVFKDAEQLLKSMLVMRSSFLHPPTSTKTLR